MIISPSEASHGVRPEFVSTAFVLAIAAAVFAIGLYMQGMGSTVTKRLVGTAFAIFGWLAYIATLCGSWWTVIWH